MPYYRFDMTFINVENLPAGSHSISLQLQVGVVGLGPNMSGTYATLPASGSYSYSYDTSAPPSGDPFQLAETDPIWIEAQVYTEYTGPNTDKMLVYHSLGPYAAGDVGVEVPAP